ncbi:MAG: hypothetical protein ABR946_11465 [Solirubrobacteraceae bacterium]
MASADGEPIAFVAVAVGRAGSVRAAIWLVERRADRASAGKPSWENLR